MRNIFLWILFYTVILASSQVLLKLGANQIGAISLKEARDIFPVGLSLIKNPLIMGGIILMASSFFLWLYILSWFKLGLVFPLTAMTYVFVALLSFFLLGEKLSFINYFGIAFIATGIYLLLYQ